MLVLTRKKSESIVIGEGVTITIVQIGDGRVRLGIEAPKQVPIIRSELGEARKPANSFSTDLR